MIGLLAVLGVLLLNHCHMYDLKFTKKVEHMVQLFCFLNRLLMSYLLYMKDYKSIRLLMDFGIMFVIPLCAPGWHTHC